MGLVLVPLAGCGENAPLTSHGKPVSHWLEALDSPDVKTRKKAVVALGHVGTADPAALPALIRATKDRSPDVRGAVPAGLRVVKVSTLSGAVADLLALKDSKPVPSC